MQDCVGILHVCACVCVRMCVRACMCVCVCVYVGVLMDTASLSFYQLLKDARHM